MTSIGTPIVIAEIRDQIIKVRCFFWRTIISKQMGSPMSAAKGQPVNNEIRKLLIKKIFEIKKSSSKK